MCEESETLDLETKVLQQQQRLENGDGKIRYLTV